MLWRKHKSLAPAGNRTWIPRLSSSSPSHYTDCAFKILMCLFYVGIKRGALSMTENCRIEEKLRTRFKPDTSRIQALSVTGTRACLVVLLVTLSSPMVALCTTTFNTHKFYVLPTQCIYVICMDLRTNSEHFSILIVFFNRD
jgi:hypothetical protein